MASPLAALSAIEDMPLAVLIGPGRRLRSRRAHAAARASVALPISLGPRIMRADTAAVAALALVNAALGDWR